MFLAWSDSYWLPRLHGCWAAEELAYIIKTDSGSEFESLLQEHCFRQPEMAYS